MFFFNFNDFDMTIFFDKLILKTYSSVKFTYEIVIHEKLSFLILLIKKSRKSINSKSVERKYTLSGTFLRIKIIDNIN